MQLSAVRRRWAGWIAVACVLGAAGFAGHAAGAQAEKAQGGKAPQKKDTPARLQPKEVKLTTVVSPAKAKPGDTVTYKVTAKVAEPWHIYSYAKVQPEGAGPEHTRFDFFDPAGLNPVGDWEPDAAPIQKKEPAFEQLPFVEFHEGEVTWSLRLKVPADAKAGKKTLRSQIYFQICDPNSCKPPARITVPDASVTIEGAGSASLDPDRSASLAGLLVAIEAPPEAACAQDAEVPRPRKKDTPARLQPKEVKLSTAASPAKVKPGGTVTYAVTAKVAEPWHIYSYAKAQREEPGPQYTLFDVFDPAGLSPAGGWSTDAALIRKPESAFPELPFVEYHEGQVTWSLKLKVPADAAAGKKTVRSQIFFQICGENGCKQGWITVPEASVTIEGEGSASLDLDRTAALANLLVAVEAPKGGSATPDQPVAGSVQEAIGGGLLAFIAWSALGGVAALLMPCVWPMIPVTVNFFVKQGQRKEGKPFVLAWVYGSSIIAIFTAVGLLCAVLFSGASLVRLANNGWLNLFVAGTFLAFGLSLLGLFEIRLPNFLLNASSQGESRGGLIGVMFMATTLVITSFTCTFPVVGSLLVLAGKGQFFYPIVGMLVFSTVLAAPFLVLALVPGLLSRLPKSGDWMNAVKVVGGLIEIGAAFKFLNTAEIGFGASPGDAWFDAQVVMAIWVVMLLVCGIYLLGLFRTDHDHESIQVGPGRLLFGIFFLGFGLYLAPSLFGYPPRSKVYDKIVGLLPPDSGELDATEEVVSKTAERLAGLLPAAGNPAAPQIAQRGGDEPRITGARKAKSKDPKVAILEEIKYHGVPWGMSYEAALAEAKAKNKPILVDFTGVNCANCRTAEKSVMPRPETVAELQKFVTVALYTDQVDIDTLPRGVKEDLAQDNLAREADLTEQLTSPLYTVLTPDGKLVGYTGFQSDPEFLAKFLREMQAKLEAQGAKAAAAPGGSKDEPKPAEARGEASSRITGARKATSKDAKEAVLQEVKFHGVPWGMSYEAALAEAKAKNKPVLIDFTGVNCATCRTTERSVMPRPDTVAELKKFVTVSLFTDSVDIDTLPKDVREDLALANAERELDLTQQTTSPLYAVLTPEGKLVGFTGYQNDPEFLAKFLREMQAKLKAQGVKMAEAEGAAGLR